VPIEVSSRPRKVHRLTERPFNGHFQVDRYHIDGDPDIPPSR
jgi:hypothetical protein